ncbi:hypothetical protein OESDEN_08681 [Oesophagostomum dentatum]|uniref:Mitochondrial carrier protein n=1 Tax=Oesophagostomum dentatum TaxID=61180 RepID=A0A0B1T5M6_OESDE|nr:hypothetical protein OESDEN_08681 [Oesophagostomum dentatum]
MNAYRGIIDCAIKTARQETIYGLYKGMWVPFLSTGALHSLLFAGYGAALRVLHPGESNVEARKDLPMSEVQRENVSRSTAHSSKLYSGPMECATRIVQNEGVKGLFKGGKVIFMRDSIGYLFYIPVYELILRFMRARNVNDTGAQLLAGGCAGVSGWLSVCPLEVVKNRIQAENSTRSMTATQIVRYIWRHEGARSFYRGGLAMAIRGFIVNAVIFLVYENIYSLIDTTPKLALSTS